jgi:hypothetical protein
MKLSTLFARFLFTMLLLGGLALIRVDSVHVADGCGSTSGGGGSDQFYGPITVPPDTTIDARMNAAPGAGTAILVFELESGSLVLLSVKYSSPHEGHYESEHEATIFLLLDWEFNGQPENNFTLNINCGGAGPLAQNLLDGRFNNFQDRDVAAPVAIYLNPLKVYGIDPVSSDGWLALDISDAEIEAAGVPDDAPIVLGRAFNHYTGIEIAVYRLTTGDFQLNKILLRVTCMVPHKFRNTNCNTNNSHPK